jgi:hypothetical protein
VDKHGRLTREGTNRIRLLLHTAAELNITIFSAKLHHSQRLGLAVHIVALESLQKEVFELAAGVRAQAGDL